MDNAPNRRLKERLPTEKLEWDDAPDGDPMLNAMIDLETLGTKPGCAILSIGAAMFGPAGVGETFYSPVLLQSCTDVGLAIDASTVAWWMDQSAEARAAFRVDAPPLVGVLCAFSDWFVANQAKYSWCHGATFDAPILEAAFKACGLSAPWEFWNVRDTRTLYDLAGVKPDRSAGTHHHALDDAISQAQAAVAALGILADRRCRAQGGDTGSELEVAQPVPVITERAAPSAGSIEGLTRWTFDGGMTASVSKDGQWYAVTDVELLLATQSAKQGALPSDRNEEILALHHQLAGEKLRADQGWARAEAKSCECIELLERMAQAAPERADLPSKPLSGEHAAIIGKQVAEWRQEVARLQDLIDTATGGAANARQQGAQPSASANIAEMAASRITDDDSARSFVAAWHREHFPTDRTFTNYIMGRNRHCALAGDFAWQLAKALESMGYAQLAAAPAAPLQTMDDTTRDEAPGASE